MKKIYIAIAIFALYFGFFDSDKVDMYSYDVDAACSVVMFTTDWCPVCKTAKTYFDNKQYGYCEFDVEKDSVANHFYKELDTGGVPTILVGNRMTVGFNPQKIDDLIAGLEK